MLGREQFSQPWANQWGLRLRTLDGGEDVAFAKQQEVVVANADFFTGVRGEQNFVTRFDRQSQFRSIALHVTIADCDDGTPLRLILGRVRQHDSASGRFFSGIPLQDNSITQ